MPVKNSKIYYYVENERCITISFIDSKEKDVTEDLFYQGQHFDSPSHK